MSTRRITVVSPWTYPSVGGTQELVHALSYHLSVEQDFDVTVITAAYPASMEGVLRRHTDAAHYTTIRLPITSADCRWLRRKGLPAQPDIVFANCVDAIRQTEPDVVLYTPHYCACAYQVSVACECLSVPFVLWPAIHRDQDTQCSTSAQDFYRRADGICANTCSEMGWLVRQAGVCMDRIAVCECGVWPSAVRAIRNLRERRSRRAYDPVRILSVGQLRPHKRFEDQCAAVEMLRNNYRLKATLTIAGAAADGCEDTLEHLRRAASTRSVSLYVSPTQPGIDQLMATTDFFVFTSASESYGIALLTALACGVYPIVYPHPVYSSMVTEAHCGKISADSTPESLAVAILQAQRDEAHARKIAPRFSEWLRAHTWSAVASRASGVIRRACAS